jgi:hypothetical protein
MQYGQFSSQDRSGPPPPATHAPEPAPAPTPVAASFRELRRARAAVDERWKVDQGRKGVLGAWLALTAPPPASALASLTERERLRKAELSAYVLFGILLIGLVLIPNGLANKPTLLSAAIIIASAVLAAMLNRADRTTEAALMLIGAFYVALGGALVAAPNLDLMWMPALDFFAVPVLLAGLLLPRWAPFVAAGLGSAAVVALLQLKPRDPWLTTMVSQLGIYHFMVRPIALMLVVAIASWLWSRSVEQAIRRADRAEEVAAMEHQLAEQKRQLDRGIQNLLETHVRVANGDFSARAATSQDNMLWQIAVSLNNLLSRLGKYAYLEQRLQHTEHEIDRLAGALENAQTGRKPAWPAPSGTRVDRLLAAITGRSAAAHMTPGMPDLVTSPTVRMPGRPAQRASRDSGPHRVPPITGQWREVPATPQGEKKAANGAEAGASWPQTPHMPARPIESVDGFRPAPFTGTDDRTRAEGQGLSSGSSAAGGVPAWLFPQAQSHGQSQPEPPARSRAPDKHNGWHASPAPRPSAPPSHWAMEPLPPLPPLPQTHTVPGTDHGANGSQLDGQNEAAAPNAHANGHGAAPGGSQQMLAYGFSESFPGQLQRPAHAEPVPPFVEGPATERDQPEQHMSGADETRSMPAMEGVTEGVSQPRGQDHTYDAEPGGQSAQGNEMSWPDWPAFLKSLDDPAQ